MFSVITNALKWLLEAVILKTTVFGIIFSLVTLLAPKLLEKISPYIGTAGLSNAFANLPAGIWYFVDIFRLDFGLPLLIAAAVARFLIRRIPVIG